MNINAMTSLFHTEEAAVSMLDNVVSLLNSEKGQALKKTASEAAGNMQLLMMNVLPAALQLLTPLLTEMQLEVNMSSILMVFGALRMKLPADRQNELVQLQGMVLPMPTF
ncbi:hypothetical protein PCE1_003755 [Barthelona sp. PCE]